MRAAAERPLARRHGQRTSSQHVGSICTHNEKEEWQAGCQLQRTALGEHMDSRSSRQQRPISYAAAPQHRLTCTTML